MKALSQKFTDHPKSNNMTYGGHFLFAVGLAAEFWAVAITLVIHAVFPFWFETEASEFVEHTHDLLNNH